MESLEENQLPIQHILVLGILSVMAAFLPSSKLICKVSYVAVEILLIFYGATLGYLHVLPTLYLIVLIQSCFLFESVGRWAVAGLSFLLFLVHQVRYVENVTLLVSAENRHLFWMHLIAETLMFGLGLFFALKLVSTLLSERQTKEQLAIAHKQLQNYALQVEDLAAIQERNRIAREIHDSLGHTLTAQNIQLQSAVKLWQQDVNRAKGFVEQAQRLAAIAMQEVRCSVSTLRADVREQLCLQQAIEALIEDFRQGTGMFIAIDINLQASTSSEIDRTLYRILQEALTNINKYAQATVIKIQLRTVDEFIQLTVTDNGVGFDLAQVAGGFGLQGMRERVAAFDGHLRIESAPSRGCQIQVELPLRRMRSNGTNAIHTAHPGNSLHCLIHRHTELL
ncbi:sensor histidine kinase [Leptolyngbya sp. NK1-12]|uniref:sensor histidine kinase n=1 Tax=Leptolyngbya sp. NK1-12 TaxID=2547451 RepID=UPI00292E18AD|nr:sensor histidine kinase [Leptolyngbya sp. NK1-12]